MNRAVTFAGRAAAARALSTSASAGASNGAAASAHWALAATLAAGASVLAMDSKASCAADVTTQLKDIKSDLESIKIALGVNTYEMANAIETIKANKVLHPDNLACKLFDMEYYNSLNLEDKKALLRIVNSGVVNGDSGMGCYAMNPTEYDKFFPFFNAVIKAYHKVDGEVHHVTNWDYKNTPKIAARLPAGGLLDLTKLGLGQTSMRVRVGRNLAAFPLPGAMTQTDRVELEGTMVKAFKKLIADKNYGGHYYSLTPGSPYEISTDFYKQLVKAHIMFKNMDDDSYLKSAGIASDWPYGRGVYVSADKQFIVWVGEEDHLRIMCMKKGTVLNEVFDRLSGACDVVEGASGKFAHSKTFGYVTSCPTNLGTGMRASLHIKLPNLTKDGTDAKAKAILKPLGLSVRGLGGEHTPIGADGTIDVSPSARLHIEEAEIICALYEGIEKVLKAEKEAAN